MIKQVIVIRTEFEKDGKPFKIRRGKEIAQACHASMKFFALKLRDNVPLTEIERTWLTEQKFMKIILQVKTEQELLDIFDEATNANIMATVVEDCGLTEFDKPTITAVGIGPDLGEEIDKITGHLKLL